MVQDDTALSNTTDKASTGKKVKRVIFPAAASPKEIADALNTILMKTDKPKLGYHRQRFGKTNYTWVSARIDGNWYGLGAPWPCVRPKRAEVLAKINQIKTDPALAAELRFNPQPLPSKAKPRTPAKKRKP